VPKYLLFWFVFRVLGLLPLPALYWIADVAAAIGFRAARGARAAVLDNLRHVMPEATEERRTEVAKQSFRSVAYYYADLAHLPRMDMSRFIEERLILHGVEERLLPAMRRGEGAIMLSGHYGNPEFVLQAAIPLGIRGSAVTEPVEPPRLAKMMNDIRSTHGVEFLPVGVSGVKHMIRTIRGGGAIALMGDRDIEGPRMLLPFFGRPAWMPTGPIELGLRTGVPIYPSFCWRRERYRIEAFFEEPLEIERTEDLEADVRSAALKWIARFEHYLREDPGQWFVLERIWDTKSPHVAKESAREQVV
jgi:KDO2-lipid IV(A) lauroyltransferase